MAVESRRGCGYRKQFGLYLVGSGSWRGCDRLPYPLTSCPTCGGGVHQSRGWTWIDWNALAGQHEKCRDKVIRCQICQPLPLDRVGLLWIGEKFYKTPDHFKAEALKLGISRRISAIPREFVAGKTWVLLAHPKGMQCTSCQGTGKQFDEEFISMDDDDDAKDCENCNGKGYLGAVVTAFLPEAVEKILPQSLKGSEEEKALRKKGIRPVFVPDNDKDHQGNVHDDE